MLKVAYLFYYATEVVFKPSAETDGSLKERLMQLVSDALIIADQSGFDVFNALTLMDNAEFIPDLKVCSKSGPHPMQSIHRERLLPAAPKE